MKPTIVTPSPLDLRAGLASARSCRPSRRRGRRSPSRAASARRPPPGSASARAAGDERGRDRRRRSRGSARRARLLLRACSLRRQLRRVAAARSPRPATPRSRKVAPRLSTCSRTAGRTSKPETTAPSRRAVAIACRPGDAGAEHEHLRGRDRAGRGHQQREEAWQPVGGEQRRPCSRRPCSATRARPSTARA